MGVYDTPEGHPPHHRGIRRRRTARLVVLGLIALTVGSVRLPEPWQQAWAAGWYPALQRHLAPVARLLPVAALDLLIAFILLALGITAWRLRRRRVDAASALAEIACAAATGWLAFQMLWGWHYQAPALEARLADQAVVAAIPPARAVTVVTHAVERLNMLHGEAHARAWPAGPQARAAIDAALRDVLRDLDVRWRPALPLPRRSLIDGYFRRAGIDGMTNPFGLEIILNSRLLDVERPNVLAHEWAHLAGFADESDASFVAWMAGVRTGGQQEYAAWLGVLPHLMGALSPEERRACLEALHQGPRADLRAIAARMAERWPAVQELAWRIYDRFLKANRVTDGVARYDAVTRLILAAADERTGQLRRPLNSSGSGRGP